MSNNNSASSQLVTPALVLISTNSDISVTFLQHQIPDDASLRLVRCASVASVDASFKLLLIDAGSLSELACFDLLKSTPNRPVALFNATPELALSALQNFPWIKGVFYKNTSRENFRSGIQILLADGDWLPRALMEKLIARYRLFACASDKLSSLTQREKQILRLAGNGLSNVDIADQINLSIHTVKSHVHNALYKLGATNRAQAASMVLRHVDGTEA
ncbi:response regulator transcription factor [Halopseudomonas nanhaiensis]|uniref:helix-turn-helix transcriptional regulator n=1 Tax=Halopseudomonas nanhaiensis TaxID=2830842 RepID=UPI001CBC14F0|nr:response regulator transcription factor [Halopseudomonas nanhaiensis]UAW97411.1 response regulator transcription factor [Halopseudomonas nanhaiensis]